ncbi:MAG: hypothetical protein V3S51_02940 [Dehalococcoidia bacterium]
MIGITSYGAYIPLHRLDRAELFRAWGGILGMSVPGEKAVAGFDEDCVTMAVEAAIDCMGSVDPKAVDGLFFASTTHPYNEKQSSAIISVALDLGREIRAADFGGSLRAGTIAMASAMDAIKAGSAKRHHGGCRRHTPGSAGRAYGASLRRRRRCPASGR